MAIIANTFTTAGAEGLREDLSDIIYDISPSETPVVSSIGRGTASQTLFRWQTDALRAGTTTNAQIQGDDVTSFPAIVPTREVGNFTQIMRELVVLSDTLEAVDKAGRNSELARQVARKGLALRLDMETTLLANIGGVVGSPTTASRTATLGAWVETNTNFDATSGADPDNSSTMVPAAGRTDAAGIDQRDLTEAIFQDVINQMWLSGANIDNVHVYAGPVNKQRISAFQGVVTRNFDISNTPRPTAVIAAVDVFVSDFGTVRIHPSRNQRERDVWFIDPEFLSVDHLRPFKTEELAKTGDAHKRMILTEWGLRVKNEAALGLAADLTES